MRRTYRSPFNSRSTRHKRFSPLIFVGAAVSLVFALGIGAVVFVLPHFQSHAEALNGNCTLIVPVHPLTAQGLATPYQLMASDSGDGPCNESNPGQAAFVQAAILDPNTGNISIYDPLVIDRGTQPAVAPVVPTIPAAAVVGIWFGFNGTNLALQNSNNSLQEGHCVNGIDGSIFGQVSYCNAPAFFQAANRAIAAGKLAPPALGKARDGLSCPSTRDFSIVDQDQSDNVTTTYLVTRSGQMAQNTQANLQTVPGAVLANGSDERLVTLVDNALGCTPWMAPNLANPGHMVPALPLNELQAAAQQSPPVALVPGLDPMVVVDNEPNLTKLNAYRVGVDQLPAQNLGVASTRLYCTNLLAIAPQRLALDAPLTKAQDSPDPAVANTLFTFLAQRFVTTYEANGLNCTKLLDQPDPVKVKTDKEGVAIDAIIDGTRIGTPMDCSINGQLIIGCTGTTNINGQPCSFALDREAHQVKITCPPGQ